MDHERYEKKKHLLILTGLKKPVQIDDLTNVLLKRAALSKYQIKCLMNDLPRVVCTCNTVKEVRELADEMELYGCITKTEPVTGNFSVDIHESHYKSLKKEISRALRSKISLTLVYVHVKSKDPADIIPSVMGPLGKSILDCFRESDTLYPISENRFFLLGYCTGLDGVETLANKVIFVLQDTILKKIDITIGYSVFPEQSRATADLISDSIENTMDIDGVGFTGIPDEAFNKNHGIQYKRHGEQTDSSIQLYFSKARGRLFKRLISLDLNELWAGISTLSKANQEAFIYRLPYNFPFASSLEKMAQTQPSSDIRVPSVRNRLEDIISSMNLENSLPERYKNQDAIFAKLSRTEALPLLPTVVQKIIGIVSDPESSLESLTGVMETDPTLTLKVLKIVNSAFFGYSKKIDNVKEAVLRLGYGEVLNLALGLAASKTLESKELEGCINPDTLWHHSLGTALIAKHLCGKIPRMNDRSGFTSGLLHDIGKIFMIENFPDMYMRVHLDALKFQLPLYEIEEEQCNINHAKIGELITAKWGLPHDLVLSIAKHHQFLKKDQSAEFSAVICLADFLYHMTDAGENVDVASTLSTQLTYGHSSVLKQLIDPFNEEVVEDLAKEASELLHENRDIFL